MAEIKPVRHARPCGDFCAEIDSRVDEQYLVLVGSEGLDVPELVAEFNRATSLDLEVGSACRAAVLDAVIPDAIEGIPRGLSLGGSEGSRSAGLELELTLDGLNVTCGNAGIRLDVVLVIAEVVQSPATCMLLAWDAHAKGLNLNLTIRTANPARDQRTKLSLSHQEQS